MQPFRHERLQFPSEFLVLLLRHARSAEPGILRLHLTIFQSLILHVCRAIISDDGLATCTATDPSDASHGASVRAAITRSNSTGRSSQDNSFSESMHDSMTTSVPCDGFTSVNAVIMAPCRGHKLIRLRNLTACTSASLCTAATEGDTVDEVRSER